MFVSRSMPIVVSMFLVLSAAAHAQEISVLGPEPNYADAPEQSLFGDNAPELYNTGLIVNFDNDGLVPGTDDADYTGGLGITLAGRRATKFRLSLHPTLQGINRILGVSKLHERNTRVHRHAMQIGLIAFTPDDLTADEPVPGDRPYANLLFLSNAHLSLRRSENIAYRSTLTIGILGLGIAEALQDSTHRVTGNNKAKGYDNQISDGGELTFRYAVSRNSLLSSGYSDTGRKHEVTFGTEAGVGYLTEGSAAISARWGRISTPWWSFTPDLTDYLARPITAPRGFTANELYFWGGIKLRARLYNSFLQGQIRDSTVTLSSGELNHLIGEAWLGVTAALNDKYTLSYSVRYQTKEIKSGSGARNITCGSLTLTRVF